MGRGSLSPRQNCALCSSHLAVNVCTSRDTWVGLYLQSCTHPCRVSAMFWDSVKSNTFARWPEICWFLVFFESWSIFLRITSIPLNHLMLEKELDLHCQISCLALQQGVPEGHCDIQGKKQSVFQWNLSAFTFLQFERDFYVCNATEVAHPAYLSTVSACSFWTPSVGQQRQVVLACSCFFLRQLLSVSTLNFSGELSVTLEHLTFF